MQVPVPQANYAFEGMDFDFFDVQRLFEEPINDVSYGRCGYRTVRINGVRFRIQGRRDGKVAFSWRSDRRVCVANDLNEVFLYLKARAQGKPEALMDGVGGSSVHDVMSKVRAALAGTITPEVLSEFLSRIEITDGIRARLVSVMADGRKNGGLPRRVALACMRGIRRG
ncbi:MAG: hypothetical protein V1679_00475 [Candidatus Peregrinibacteria bacterium]